MLVAANRVITASAIERTAQDQDAAKAGLRPADRAAREFATSQSRLITELPVFRAHLSEPQIANDSATIQALAEQYPQSLASDFLLVADCATGRGWGGRTGPVPDAPTGSS